MHPCIHRLVGFTVNIIQNDECIFRECKQLKLQQKSQTQVKEELKTCTKGTTSHIHRRLLPTFVPSQVREITWLDLKRGLGENHVLLGRGVVI